VEKSDPIFEAIPEDHAHPNMDYKDRIALFHNGRIANSEDLLNQIGEMKVQLPEGQTLKNMTDS
jgi:glucosamine 6-phosphate synthetase-like amidotransferase/phosphosugar isomerase protein